MDDPTKVPDPLRFPRAGQALARPLAAAWPPKAATEACATVPAGFSKGGMDTSIVAPRPLLIVEDDEALRSTLAERLSLDGGFAPAGAGSVAEAEALLGGAEDGFDAVLLDIGLPDGDGRELCARLRNRGLKMPVIMLSGADAEHDVVRGLDAGANDYVPKPLRLGELLARVRAQLRLFDDSDGAVLTIGPYVFRPAAKLLLDPARGRKLRLTIKEVGVLKRLHRAGGRPVPCEVLLQEVWGYSSEIDTHTLQTHIYRLRQKIEPDPSRPRLLLLAKGGGAYSLGGCPPVRSSAAGEGPAEPRRKPPPGVARPNAPGARRWLPAGSAS